MTKLESSYPFVLSHGSISVTSDGTRIEKAHSTNTINQNSYHAIHNQPPRPSVYFHSTPLRAVSMPNIYQSHYFSEQRTSVYSPQDFTASTTSVSLSGYDLYSFLYRQP